MKRLKTTLLTVILTATLGGNAMAADYRNNPFTLTYETFAKKPSLNNRNPKHRFSAVFATNHS